MTEQEDPEAKEPEDVKAEREKAERMLALKQQRKASRRAFYDKTKPAVSLAHDALRAVFFALVMYALGVAMVNSTYKGELATAVDLVSAIDRFPVETVDYCVAEGRAVEEMALVASGASRYNLDPFIELMEALIAIGGSVKDSPVVGNLTSGLKDYMQTVEVALADKVVAPEEAAAINAIVNRIVPAPSFASMSPAARALSPSLSLTMAQNCTKVASAIRGLGGDIRDGLKSMRSMVRSMGMFAVHEGLATSISETWGVSGKVAGSLVWVALGAPPVTAFCLASSVYNDALAYSSLMPTAHPAEWIPGFVAKAFLGSGFAYTLLLAALCTSLYYADYTSILVDICLRRRMVQARAEGSVWWIPCLPAVFVAMNAVGFVAVSLMDASSYTLGDLGHVLLAHLDLWWFKISASLPALSRGVAVLAAAYALGTSSRWFLDEKTKSRVFEGKEVGRLSKASLRLTREDKVRRWSIPKRIKLSIAGQNWLYAAWVAALDVAADHVLPYLFPGVFGEGGMGVLGLVISVLEPLVPLEYVQGPAQLLQLFQGM